MRLRNDGTPATGRLVEFRKSRKGWCRGIFVAAMNRVNASEGSCEQVESAYLERQKGDGPVASGAELTLCIDFLQQWYMLSDPAVGAVYESRAIRKAAGVGLRREAASGGMPGCAL